MVRRMATGAPRSDPSRLPALLTGLRWRRVFPGEERQLAALRRWLSELLPPCSARDDLATVATELGSNAIKHTGSGRPGGWFTVEITWHEAAVVLAVADQGGLTEPQVVDNPDGERGRGLLVVRGLSGRTGFAGDERGRLVWAQVDWTGVDASGPPSQAPYESAIRDDEATLARQLAGVPAWFGQSTLMWWALAGPRGLVSAPTAHELARLLGDAPDAPGAAEFHSPGRIPRHIPSSWPVLARHCQPAVRGLGTICRVPDWARASSGRRTHMLMRLVRFPLCGEGQGVATARRVAAALRSAEAAFCKHLLHLYRKVGVTPDPERHARVAGLAGQFDLAGPLALASGTLPDRLAVRYRCGWLICPAGRISQQGRPLHTAGNALDAASAARRLMGPACPDPASQP